MADAETPRVKLEVRVVLVLAVAVDVGLLLGVCDGVTEGVRVVVPVIVPDALAPSERLLVGVYDACGQKHSSCQPLNAVCWQDGEEP